MLVYVDDMLVCSKTYEEHIKHLKEFSTICRINGIILSQKKVEIKKEEIDFLGLTISANGIKLQTHISEKIKDFPDILSDKKTIQKFLGCLNYSESFIPNLAKKRAVLQKLLKKNNTKGWTAEHIEAVKELKAECNNLPKLRLPEENDNLIIQSDASDSYWAALLKTDIGEICKYTSGTFSTAEINYSTNEKELLAIVKGIRKFTLFLLPKEFTVETDNT